MAKGKLRIDKETGLPALVIVNQLQLYCHHEVEEETDLEITKVKMRPSMKFINELNKRVLELLDESIKNALSENRTDLCAEDVPVFAE